MGILIFDSFITLIAVGYTAYLIYARRRPRLIENKIQKYKSGTREHSIYRQLYTPQFLAIALITSLSFAWGLTIDLVETLRGNAPFVLKSAGLLINLTLGAVALYLLYKLFWKRR